MFYAFAVKYTFLHIYLHRFYQIKLLTVSKTAQFKWTKSKNWNVDTTTLPKIDTEVAEQTFQACPHQLNSSHVATWRDFKDVSYYVFI